MERILHEGWYTTKHLLAGYPDTNMRFLYYRDERVAEFPVTGQRGAHALDKELDEICRRLNALSFNEPL